MLGFGKIVDEGAKTSTPLWRKSPFPYIFAFSPPDSCLPPLYIVYIFCRLRGILAVEENGFITICGGYPQTHSLWIISSVDEETSQNHGLKGFGERLCTGFPHGFRKMSAKMRRCIWMNSCTSHRLHAAKTPCEVTPPHSLPRPLP